MLALMRVLSDGIETETAAADALVALAAMPRADGCEGMAKTMRKAAQHHRIAVLKHQGQLAEVRAEYARLFSDQPLER